MCIISDQQANKFSISLHRFASRELALLTLSGESGAGKALKPEPPFLLTIHTQRKKQQLYVAYCNYLKFPGSCP